MTALRVLRNVIVAALWASLVVYAATVGHNFYRSVDRAIYVTTDDSEAGIAYALGTEGRYGFLASPMLEGMSQLHGQFNYGPWYLYLAAGITWLFGYSLTAIRSIHLWVVIGSAAAAGAWFRQRDRAVIPALFGFGILYFFETVEWPMARPDSLVSAFAVGMIVSTGLAVTRKRPVYWFLAGLAGACGAFTHLIAASLMVSSVVLYVASAAVDLHEASDRSRVAGRLRSSAVALAMGLAAGAAMFYASFGFDVAKQYRFLRGYRDLTASADTYVQTLAHHFGMAFSVFPVWFQGLVAVTLVTAWALIVVVVRRASPHRQVVMAYLLPPAMVWTLYFLSTGKYTNYHSGYAILHHVMFLWTAAAVLWVACAILAGRRPRLAMVAGMLASVAVLAQGVRLTAWTSANNPRVEKSESLVAFSDYANHVLRAIPARATAWGSVVFGIESPDRIQLVQRLDAMSFMLRLPVAQRQALAPDYLVWDSESRVNIPAALGNPEMNSGEWFTLGTLLPDSRFRLVSLTSGAPYGVARVYARSESPASRTGPLPDVAAYDASHGRWLTRVGAAVPAVFARVPPVAIQIGPNAASPSRIARETLAAELRAGAYLLRVSVTPGTGQMARRIIAVVSPSAVGQATVELGPSGDFAPYLADEHEVFALATHAGGALQVSEIGDAPGAGIDAVTVYPVHGLLDPAEQPSRSQPLPAFAAWTSPTDVHLTRDSGRLRVDGDATASGYQVSSPVISYGKGDRIEVRVPNMISSGRVCPGVLNADSSRWLIPPDVWREELKFRADATGGFLIVFANCNKNPQPAKSRFEIAPGSYVDYPAALYADTLVDNTLRPKQRTDIQPEDLSYSAKILKHTAVAWAVEGHAESKYSYLMVTKPRMLDAAARVVVSGHITRGGLTIGLQTNDRWAALQNVDAPGDFTTVLEPAGSGSYSLIIANYLDAQLETSIMINRVEISTTGSGR